MNQSQDTNSIKKRFEWDAESFSAIYDRDKSEFSTWFNKMFRKPVFERYEITFKEMHQLQNKSVLDVGCGSGVYSIQAALNGAARVKGIDFSEPMLKLAQSKSKKSATNHICEFELNDFLKMQIHERFNFVIALGIFDYLIDPVPFLKKMREVATTRVIASFPGHSLIREPLRKLRYLLTSRGKVHFYDKAEIQHLISHVPFSSCEIRPLQTGSGFMLLADV